MVTVGEIARGCEPALRHGQVAQGERAPDTTGANRERRGSAPLAIAYLALRFFEQAQAGCRLPHVVQAPAFEDQDLYGASPTARRGRGSLRCRGEVEKPVQQAYSLAEPSLAAAQERLEHDNLRLDRRIAGAGGERGRGLIKGVAGALGLAQDSAPVTQEGKAECSQVVQAPRIEPREVVADPDCQAGELDRDCRVHRRADEG